jgi:hypothetical protein
VLDIHTDFIESPELVRDRVIYAVNVFGDPNRIHVTPDSSAGISRYHYECSGDNGATWPGGIDASADSPTALIGNLTNGVDYLCRAFAANTTGLSDASPLSDLVKPCGSTLECNSSLLPIIGALLAVLLGGLLVAVIMLFRGRSQGHVIAVVDVVHTANIGHGSKLGIGFVLAPGTRRMIGIVADRGPHADIRVRQLRGGRFEVIDRVGKRVAADGEAIVVADSVGVRHALLLRAFATNAASAVATRR